MSMNLRAQSSIIYISIELSILFFNEQQVLHEEVEDDTVSATFCFNLFPT